LQRARVKLRKRLPTRKPPWAATVDASAAERDLLKKYFEASEAADFRAFESTIRADATFRMPPDFGAAEGRDEMFKLWREEGSERFGRLRCVVTHANLQPAVAAYVCRPGDSIWRAMVLDVLRIGDGLITEIVAFMPDNFPAFGLPMVMDPAQEMNQYQKK
jgi:SnoaL-like domain